MSGHVFVVHGDLTHLACDEWLLPTDRELTLTDGWLPTLRDDAVRRGADGVPRLATQAPDAFCTGRQRVLPVPDELRCTGGTGSPVTRGRPWLLDVGTDADAEPGWLVDGVRAWLDAVGGADCRTERARPLLGLPLVGTGGGGAALKRDQVLAELLPALGEHADRHGVDVALVLNDVRDHAAAQDVRHRLGGSAGGLGPWDLDKELVDAADELATCASDGDLSLFLGAGVSRAAGLPLWKDVVDELLDAAGVDDDERAAVTRLEVPDQAEYVARRLGGGDELRTWVQERFAPRPHALAHALLATLPVRETVTTNWDALFEQAVGDTGRRISVLPYDDPAGADTWLLKLHGDAGRGDDLVIRRSDYLRFGAEQSALAGVVQSLLFTRHMLFVGFSLVDENFIRIADEVTRIVDRYGGREDGGSHRLGTTLGLHPDPAKRLLWPHLDHLVVAPDQADDRERARGLEVFLDLLSARVGRNQAYLLDERYAGLLEPADRSLAEHLGRIAESGAELREATAWPQVERLLDALGHPPRDIP